MLCDLLLELLPPGVEFVDDDCDEFVDFDEEDDDVERSFRNIQRIMLDSPSPIAERYSNIRGIPKSA